MATDVGRVAISQEALEDLQMRIRGAAMRAEDPGITGVRETFNAMHKGLPSIAVSCTGTQDVVDGVNFARERGMTLAVRGGGHSIAGLSTISGGVLLDLAPMRGVHVDVTRRRVHVQGGALWGDVDRETTPFNLAVPGGVVSDTGVGGLTLGGGYGWLRRAYGLSCDALVEAQVVCADGVVRTASEEENPDLLWALRGGGGNFGIVTDFTFEAKPLPEVVAFAAVMYPQEDAAEVMRNWRDCVERLPREVTSVVVNVTFPADPHAPEVVHDRAVTIIGGVYAGDADEGMQVMQGLRELGDPLFDMSGPTPFVGVQTGFDGLFPRGQLNAYWKSQYCDAFSDELVDLLARRAQDRPAPNTMVNMFLMGGAIADVDPEATAFSERPWPYMVSIDGVTPDPAGIDEMVAWVRSMFEEVRPYGTGGVYLNFTGLADEELDAGVDSAFGRNLRRLGQIKAQYDPDNFFRINNNIKPAA